MPAKKKAAAKKPVAKKSAAKKPVSGGSAGKSPAKKSASVTHIKERLHTAVRKAPQQVSKTEFEEITAVVLAIVAELASETAEVFGEVLARIELLEARFGYRRASGR